MVCENPTAEQGDKEPRLTCYLFTIAIFGALGGFSFGYDTGVVSGALLFIREEFELDFLDQGILVSVSIAMAMLTSFLSGKLGDKIGRKPCMLIGSFVFTISTILSGFSKAFWMLLLGRALLGIGIGVILMISPVYIAECCPLKYRGPFVTMCTGMMSVGRTVSSIVNGAFSYDKSGWRYMLGVTGVPSLMQFIAFLFLPETPRWLVRNGMEDDATKVLQRIMGQTNVGKDIQLIKDICQEEIRQHQQLQEKEWTLKRVMYAPSVRRALVVGVSTTLFQQLSGINSVMYYSGTIIQMSGVQDEVMVIWLTAVTAGVSCIFTLAGVYLVERVGRRKLILSSLAGVLLSLGVLAVGFQLSESYSPPAAFQEGTSAVQLNNTCLSYRSCGECVKNPKCGYCYIEHGYSALNGSCNPRNDMKIASSGRCNSSELSDGLIWSPVTCPSPYFWVCLLGLTLYLVTFSPGIGPLPMTINAEIYPLWARSTCMSVASSSNWLFSLVTSLSFLPLTENVSAFGTYWMFAVVVVIGFLFLFFTLPETKNRRLEELETLFETPWCMCGRSASLDISMKTMQSNN